MPRKYALIGAGNGGLALAAQLLLAGEEVSLYDVDPETIAPLAESGSLTVTGTFGEYQLPLKNAYTDLAVAVKGAHAVVLVIPASAHRAVASDLAPFLRSDQIVLLMPGRTGGALEFQVTLREAHCRARCLIGETQTLPYAARKTSPAGVHVYAVKKRVPVASLPATRTGELMAAFPALGHFLSSVSSVLETSLNNVGMIFHPAPTLLNAGRIEDTAGHFDYYHRGITPAVARLLERVDAERCTVARCLGVPVLSAVEWLGEAYGVQADSLWSAVQHNSFYQGIEAPRSLQTRYLTEDVATGLVPLVELGRLAGVETPYAKALVQIASGLLDVDFAASGRTLDRMGLAGLDSQGAHLLVGA